MRKTELADTEAQELAADASPSGRRSPRLRQRAAWMYYVEDMTQSAIAEALGVGRVTVVRMLSEARALNEVRISLSRDLAELSRLEIEVQKLYGVKEVVVAPISSPEADPRRVVAAAAASAITDLLRPDMKIGLGWGVTLSQTLGFLPDRQISGLSVVSLLGGVTRARAANPSEFAWQFSRAFLADCYLIAAPAIVDGPETKRALIDRCGLKEVFDLAEALDVVALGVGAMPTSAKAAYGVLAEPDLAELAARGAVGEMLFNFFDANGRLVDHPVNERSMSIPMPTLRRTPRRLLAAGGAAKAQAMAGAMRLLAPTTVILDESLAEALISRASEAR